MKYLCIEQRLRQRNTWGHVLAFAPLLGRAAATRRARSKAGSISGGRKVVGGLARQSRSDRGLYRAFSPQAVEAIINLRRGCRDALY